METVLVVADGDGGYYVIPESILASCRVGADDVRTLIEGSEDDVEGFTFGKRTSISDSHDRYGAMSGVEPLASSGGPFALRVPAFKWSRDNGSIAT